MTALHQAPNENGGSSSLKEASAESDHADRPGWFSGIGKYQLLVFLGCWMGGIFDGMDSTLMTVAMPAALKELLGTADKAAVSQVASYVGSIFLLGWMTGGVLFGIIGDRLGRVRAMIFSILLYAIFTGLAGLAQNWEQLALCRFLTGLGIGGELVSIATFLTEVWPQRSRAIAIGILITSYQVGVFIAGSINTVFDHWRTVFFIGALPALLVIFLRLALRESDRWMEAREREIEAGKKASPYRLLFRREYARSLLVGGISFSGLLIGYWASLSWIPLWLNDILQTADPAKVIGQAVMFQAVAAMLGCSLGGVFADWLGRRWTMMLAYLGCFLASALLFIPNTSFSPDIYWHGAILGFFIGVAQSVMYVYLPELFPTLVRASAVGFCLNVGRLVTAIVVLFVADLIRLVMQHNLGTVIFHQSGMSAYAGAAMLFAAAYLMAMAASSFGRETKGQALLD